MDWWNSGVMGRKSRYVDPTFHYSIIPVFPELLRDVLCKGADCRFQAKGHSMSPFIKDGDVLTISPFITKETISKAPSPLPSPARGEGKSPLERGAGVCSPPLPAPLRPGHAPDSGAGGARPGTGGDEGEGELCGLTDGRLNNSSISFGRIVAFIYPKTGRLVIHRVIGKKGDSYLIKGDSTHEADGLVRKTNILGLVTGVERKGKKVFIGLGPERFLIAFLTRRGILHPLLLPLWRLIRPFVRLA